MPHGAGASLRSKCSFAPAWMSSQVIHALSSAVSLSLAAEMAEGLARGPTFAHALTKRMMHLEWDMSIEQAIDAEAQAQAIAMQTQDFRRAYEAFVEKRKPAFEGN